MQLAVYLPKYKDWFSKLPSDEKSQLKIINSINLLTNNSQNRYNKPLISFG